MRKTFNLLFGLVLLAPSQALADGATEWVKAHKSQSRLLAGEPRRIPPRLLAGVQLRMEDGWKTYWRNPGDSGVPPSFDWKGSQNVKSVEVLWPAPERFSDPYGDSIGYRDEVVLPVLVTPETPARPVELALDFTYGICKEICVPAEASFKLTLLAGKEALAPHGKLIEQYLKQVPASGEEGDKNGPRVAAAKAELTGDRPRLVVDAVFPSGAEKTDLFLEGPQDYYLPLAKRAEAGADGVTRFVVDLAKSGDPAKLKGQTLTLTLVSSKAQAETRWRID